MNNGVLLDQELSGKFRRYLNGDRSTGYSICHPLFRDYLRETIFTLDQEDGETAFQDRILKFCKEWSVYKSNYALEHLPAHLIEAKQGHEIYKLINRGWRDVRVESSHSPRGFAGDVELAINLARNESVLNLFQVIRNSQIYANLTESVARMPVEVIGALVYLDHLGPALDYTVLDRDLTRQIKAYLTISRVLFEQENPVDLKEVLMLAIVAIEKIEEATDDQIKRKVGALLEHTELSRAAGIQEFLDRGLHQLEHIGVQLKDDQLLKRIADIFRKVNRLSAANEFTDRAESARDAPKDSYADYPGRNFNFGNIHIPSDLENSTRSKKNEGKLEEAIEQLENEFDALDTEQPAIKELPKRLEALIRSSLILEQQDRAKAAGQRLAELGSNYEFDYSWLEAKDVRLARFSMLLLEAGCVEESERFAFDAILSIDLNMSLGWDVYENMINVIVKHEQTTVGLDLISEFIKKVTDSNHDTRLNILARLSLILIQNNEHERAKKLVDDIIRETKRNNLSLSEIKALLELSRGTSAKSIETGKRILSAAEEKLRQFQSSANRDSRLLVTSDVLELLVSTKATIYPQADLKEERDFAEELSGLDKAQALDSMAKGLCRSGNIPEAIKLVNEIVTEIINKESEGSDDLNRAILKVSHTMALCGHSDWANREAEKISKATSNLQDQLNLVFFATDKNGDFSLKKLRGSITLNMHSIENDVEMLLAGLEAVGETAQADDLLRRAQIAVIAQLKQHPWNLKPLKVVAIASGQRQDLETLETLKIGINKSADMTWKARALLTLMSGFIVAKKTRRAQGISNTILDIIINADEQSMTQLADLPLILAEFGNYDGIELLYKKFVTDSKYRHKHEMISHILVAYINANHKAAAINMLNESDSWNWRSFSKAIFWSYAALAYHNKKLIKEANHSAKSALKHFEDEKDGSVTPNVLEHLVPALLAVEDRDALLGILGMRADKRPYEREYIPAWRRVFPALAQLGIYDIDEMHVNALRRGSESEYYATEGEISVILAEQGDMESAEIRLAAIDNALFRSAAYVKLTKLFIDRGNVEEATIFAVRAITGLVGQTYSRSKQFCPAHPTRINLLGELALHLKQSGHRGKAWRIVRRELLSSELSVSINHSDFQKSVHVLAKEDRISDLIQTEKTLKIAAAQDKAEGLVAIIEAYARARNSSELVKHLAGTKSAIMALNDVTRRAIPQARLAHSLWMCDKKELASEMLIEAFDSARVSGREKFFKVLELGSEIIASSQGIDTLKLVEEIEEIDTWEG